MEEFVELVIAGFAFTLPAVFVTVLARPDWCLALTDIADGPSEESTVRSAALAGMIPLLLATLAAAVSAAIHNHMTPRVAAESVWFHTFHEAPGDGRGSYLEVELLDGRRYWGQHMVEDGEGFGSRGRDLAIRPEACALPGGEKIPFTSSRVIFSESDIRLISVWHMPVSSSPPAS